MGKLLRNRGGVCWRSYRSATTLIARRPIVAGQACAGAAFATPTIVPFGAVLLLQGS
jgi:hypothetical protein